MMIDKLFYSVRQEKITSGNVKEKKISLGSRRYKPVKWSQTSFDKRKLCVS